jgi:hypothetical protein
LERELYELSLQKYAIIEFLSTHSQAIRALASLRSNGITEDRLIQLNNILEQLVRRKHMLPRVRGFGESLIQLHSGT